MSLSTPSTILHLRIYLNRSRTNYTVFRVLKNREYKVDQTVEDLVNSELSDEVNDTNKQLHLQRLEGQLDPLFIVEFPGGGQRFLLDSRKGITLWCSEAIDNDNPGKDTSRRYSFFSEKLEPINWTVNNLLVYLQRAYLCLPFQNPRMSSNNRSYPVNIFLRIGDNPDDPRTKFTTIFVSGDAKLADVFELLASESVEDWYALFQWVWKEDKGKYDVPIRWYYDDALEEGIAFKDCGWVDDTIVWLRPQAG